jgi:hypothetical protein
VLLLTREVPDSMAFLSERFQWFPIDGYHGAYNWIEFVLRGCRGYYLYISPLAGHETCGCYLSGMRLLFAAHESDWEVEFPVNYEVSEFAGALYISRGPRARATFRVTTVQGCREEDAMAPHAVRSCM